ncbi:MAG: hypothetical protein JW763_00660 [candidate division Zixibacteria bacterium]|nr:hypothetical protein [candidate division Zixibacteria bacterium]
MKHKSMIALCVLSALVVMTVAASARDSEPVQNYSIWVGSHYTSLTDYAKKVGEYNLGNDEFLPEFKGVYQYRDVDKLITVDGHYFDQKNIDGMITGIFGDRFRGMAYCRSMIRQDGQDLLANMAAREMTAAGDPGGKILSHEIQDLGADYNTHRFEAGTDVDILLSRKNNIRMMVAHRSIFKKGEEQKVASNHCFSCHLTSKTMDVDRQTHQFQTGIQADVSDFTVGYQFGFRYFDSRAEDVTAYYDNAQHPMTGGSQSEFASRLNYDDTTMAYGTYPETQKMSHKLRFKGDIGKGRFSSSIGYSIAKNKGTDLEADAWTGAASYTMLLAQRTRLIAKIAGTRLTSDDPFIDLADYREGMDGTNTEAAITNFDFVRYSVLDRADAKASAEVISRVSPQTTVSVMAGYNHVDRYDYPTIDEHYKTDKFYGQAKIRYRKGLRYSNMIKYRFEKTSAPFRSFRGLFEAAGRDIMEPDVTPGGTFTGYLFSYYLRENLRYQNITTQPTDAHMFEFSATYRPTMKTSIMFGVKGQYDKNGDLDSLDVKHLSLRPHANLTLNPSPKWSVLTGYTFGYYKSRGPVAVALFDG